MPDHSRMFSAAVVVLALSWLPAGCCCLPIGKSRDPKFDQVKQGMSEEAVLKLLGTPYTYQPHAAGVWLYPRMTLEEFHEDSSRNLETRDVLLVYFKDGNVIKTYRRTGEEFRRPRPPSARRTEFIPFLERARWRLARTERIGTE